MCLNKQSYEYAKILTMSDAVHSDVVHSIRSL